MASLVGRLASRNIRILTINALKHKTYSQPLRLISTSEKKKDELVDITEKIYYPPSVKPEDDLGTKEENWLSFGYSNTDQEHDYFAHHMTMFCLVTLITCCGTFFLAYLPDFRMQDWAMREAHLELARREKLGLPLIDPNLIDPARIELPSDEELGNTKIIV